MAQSGSMQRAKRSGAPLVNGKQKLQKIAKAVATVANDMVIEASKPRRVAATPPRNLLGPFRGVSAVQTAPVNLGNTLRSAQPRVTMSNDVVTVTGRDFVHSLSGQTSATGDKWAFIGGMPLTPAALVASAVRGYFQSHQHFRFKKLLAHYISSSPTSLAGDIVVMWHANRGGPKVNHDSANFLAYALSTPNSLLGPQWSNHSVEIVTSHEWRDTDILNSEDLMHQSDGEILVYGKDTVNGTSPGSPGYLIIDYVLEFKALMTNPRIQTLPSNLFKWVSVGMRVFAGGANGLLNADTKAYFGAFSTDNYTNGISTTLTGDAPGNIYQVVFDLDYNLYNPNNLTFSNLVYSKTDDNAGKITYPIGTGTTIYLVNIGSGAYCWYPTYDAALSGRPLQWVGTIINVNFGFTVILSLCGSVAAPLSQANIG